MSQENQSYLRFSLEESVWFQKGQEVAELVSISLDPNITIIENDQYVTIKGSLELTGEYQPIGETFAAEDIGEISASKFVHAVEERGEGVCEFLHRFPVDITIPNNRIQSVYDIDVTVDSFDYVFPERSCLNLSAELTISGLYGEQQHVTFEDEEFEFIEREQGIETVEKATEDVLNEDYSGLGSQQASDPLDPSEQTPELEPLYQSRFNDEHNENPNFILSYPYEQEENNSEEESQDYFEPFSAEAKKQPNDSDQAQESPWGAPLQQRDEPNALVPEFTFAAKRSETQAPPITYELTEESYNDQTETELDDQELGAEMEMEADETAPAPEQTAAKGKKFLKKKSMSIAEFLGRKTENELQAKLKVCIVQHGETLDSLSDRYKLSVHHILRVNHLEASQDVYEGQVLYIPES